MRKENTPIVVTSIIAGTVILITLLSLFVFVPMVQYGSQKTVTVQGTSTMKVLPNRVAVIFNIQTNGSTSSEANDANSVIYNKLKSAMISLGFNESQIGTQDFNVYPNYEYGKDGKRTQNGYTATHSVKIEFSSNNTALLGSVVDNGITAGAGISYINFELSTALQNQYKAQAIEAASKDANSKADAVAIGFGKSIGKLVSVQVDNYNYRPWVMYSGAGTVNSAETASAKTAAESITPSQQDVTATVSATYRLA